MRRVQRAVLFETPLHSTLLLLLLLRSHRKRTSFATVLSFKRLFFLFRPQNADNKETNGPYAQRLLPQTASSSSEFGTLVREPICASPPRENLTRPPRLKWTMNLGDEVPWIYICVCVCISARGNRGGRPPIRISFNSFRGSPGLMRFSVRDINVSYIFTNYSNYET